jgi:[ribosomal protein S5]-alanine N-acetyltransferase
MITFVAPGIAVPELIGGPCLLRGWRLSDAPALRPACGDPEICRFTTVPHRFVVEDAQDWITRQQAHACNGTGVVLAIVPIPENAPAGMVGLFGLDQHGSTARFGYWLIATQRGRGLASAATGLLAEWAFGDLQLSAIHIDLEPGNHASARVAEKLGAVRGNSRWVGHRGARVQLIRHTLLAPGSSTTR